MFMILDNAILQGQPHFPHDMVEVSGVIKGTSCAVRQPRPVGQLGVRRAQVAEHSRRQAAIDPLLSMARASHCSVLAVAHPNRGEGDLGARVGLSAVLRQAARLLLLAIEPPDDDTQLIVRIEKANAPPAHR
jgi:hypothetical protein